MMAIKYWAGAALASALIMIGGCASLMGKDEQPGKWMVQQIAVVEGLDAPECALPDPGGSFVYVSNIETPKGEYWVDDGIGFISLVTYDGHIKDLRWLNSSPQAPVNAPKGMAILRGWLYFTDNAALKRTKLDKGSPVETVNLPNAAQLNDLASDGEFIWVSDMNRGVVYRIDIDGGTLEIPAPKEVNGVTCFDGKVFAVSWGLHDLYELDPTGRKAPQPFGLAAHFESLDGIELLDDGSFIVTDYVGGKVCVVSANRKTVQTVAQMKTPADIGLDRRRGLLFVPQLEANTMRIFSIWKDELYIPEN